MDFPFKLLADYAWAAEDNKAGFLSVEVNSFNRIFLLRWPISFSMKQISTKIKYDKLR